jgi:hypothetical protein
MAAVATAGHIAGFYHAQIAFRSSTGYPMGVDSTPDVIVAAETKHAYKLTGPVEVTAPQVTREIATFRGGQVILGQRAMGVSDFGTFDMTLSAFDEVFNAYVGGSTVDVSTTTDLAQYAPNSLNPALPQFFLLLTMGFQDTSGTNKYVTYVYPNVQISPAVTGATQDGGENPGAVTYTVTPSASTRAASGHLFSAMGMTVTDNKEIVYAIRYNYPVSITTYIQETAATSFTLGYRPISDEHAGAINSFTTNGATTHSNVSAVNVATGAVTITAATASDIWVALYPTSFTAI